MIKAAGKLTFPCGFCNVKGEGRLHRGSEEMPEVTEKSRIEQENQSHGRACRRVRFFEQEYDGAGST